MAEIKVTGGLPYKVVVIDGNTGVAVGSGGGGVLATPLLVSSPIAYRVVYNITLTLANTEYSQLLPGVCRMYEFQARSEAIVRWSEIAGRVAAPVAPYLTLKAGDYYYSPEMNRTAPSTLYFATPTSGTVIELIVWY